MDNLKFRAQRASIVFEGNKKSWIDEEEGTCLKKKCRLNVLLFMKSQKQQEAYSFTVYILISS